MTNANLLHLVRCLKKGGYIAVHWKPAKNGLRADIQGKIALPTSDTTEHICLTHGNAVKVHAETHRGYKDRGVRLLTVHPCFFCQPPLGAAPK